MRVDSMKVDLYGSISKSIVEKIREDTIPPIYVNELMKVYLLDIVDSGSYGIAVKIQDEVYIMYFSVPMSLEEFSSMSTFKQWSRHVIKQSLHQHYKIDEIVDTLIDSARNGKYVKCVSWK